MLFIDFETNDPYISMGYGAGWVFALRGYNNPEFKILGASVKYNGNDPMYITDLALLADIINSHKSLVMHNAMYDLGCILALFKHLYREWNYSDITFYDTMLMAKLVDQHKFQYNLEALSKANGGAEKKKDTLTDYVWNSGMYQAFHKTDTGRTKHTRPSEAVLNSFAITHLEDMPVDVVGEYANADVEATYSLFQNLKCKLDKFPAEFDYTRYSTLLKICVEMKARGIRVDTAKALTTKEFLEGRANELQDELFKMVGNEFNINAPRQVIDALTKLGITSFAKTATGNESAKKDWLEQQSHPACKNIIKIKNYQKLARDFLTKIIDYQEIHRQNDSEDNRIFFTLNILGATKTGRFSSSGDRPGKKGYELNMQQIPKRGEDDEAAKYVRAVFIADAEETWVSADYSNQEQRLQVHFADYLGLPAADTIRRQLVANPGSDFHGAVADICSISRTHAKTINLGLSYGMGGAKLCHSLGLDTKWVITKSGREVEVPGKEGEKLLLQYHTYLPFMKGLQDYTNATLGNYGYVKTLAGRKLTIDPPMKIDNEWVSFERKGLSKLIQGSAADVTIEALVNCYNAGLKMLVTVHDEICLSSSNVAKDTATLQECMNTDVVNKFKLKVPMAIEITEGQSWAG